MILLDMGTESNSRRFLIAFGSVHETVRREPNGSNRFEIILPAILNAVKLSDQISSS